MLDICVVVLDDVLMVEQVKLTREDNPADLFCHPDVAQAWRFHIAGLVPESPMLLRRNDEKCNTPDKIKSLLGEAALIYAAKGSDVYIGPAAISTNKEVKCNADIIARRPYVWLGTDAVLSVGLWVPGDSGVYRDLRDSPTYWHHNSELVQLAGLPVWHARTPEAVDFAA